MIPQALLLLLSLIPVLHAQSDNPGLLCTDHPAYTASLTPVLVSSWSLFLSLPDSEQVVYIPRYTGHRYAPTADTLSLKYAGLDFFHTASKPRTPNFRMHFQRAAMVYMFVDVPDANYDPAKTASLIGWTSEGWVSRVEGASTITYGIHQQLTKSMTTYAYVFSKVTSSGLYADMPQTRFVKKKISGISVPGTFNLWLAEADGSASPPVGTFAGAVVQPNTVCPAALHNTWVAFDGNTADTDTDGVAFGTWHPQWDPCFWCAYDHEHGSSPKHIFGYEPKFDYGAFKNNRQNEPNRGFKGFVFSQGPYWVYYSLHVITSDLLRVTLRLHTITLVVASKSTGEILVDLTQKGDFGFQSVRLADGRSFRPLTPDDVAIQQELASGTLMFRSMNVIDANNLNRDFSFRNPLMLGQYEEWQTLPMCTRSNRKKKAVQSTFKTPGTGIKSLTETSTRVDLGRMVNGAFYKSTGLFRTLRLPKLTVAASLCPGGASGEFYTDPSGKTVVSGPGPTHVRQYVQPGFSAVFSGKYEPVDQWIGLHSRGARGFFVDHGYGIDPDLN